MSITPSKPMSPFMKFFISRILPLIILLAGLGVGYKGFKDLDRAVESKNWSKTEGVISASNVETHHSDDSTTYGAHIEYAYTVSNVSHRGERVAFGDYYSSNISHAKSIVDKYPAGRKVAVFYDPKEPDMCVLETGLKGQAFFLPVFGLVFFIAGLLMAIYLPRTMGKSDKVSTGQQIPGNE